MLNYLTAFTTQPYTRDEMVDNLMLNTLQEFDVTKLFRVKRAGKDKDPLFFSFGKVHGLENLAFTSDEELLEAEGNPVKIQQLVNKYEGY